MTFTPNTLKLHVLSTILCTSALAACGGGGGGVIAPAESVQAGVVISKGNAATTPVATPTTTPTGNIVPVLMTVVPGTTPAPAVTMPVTAAPSVPVVTAPATLAVITDVRLQNTDSTAQTSVPVTFGQIFAVGHVRTTDVLVGRLENNTLIPLQMDIKARHADGSVRHAIFSAIIPSIAGNSAPTMALIKNATVSGGTTSVPSDLLAAGFTASASATIAGVKYSASADQLLKTDAKVTWLAGPIANEWQVSAPLTTAAGVAHPHLTARFAVRYYGTIKKSRVDVTIENNWAFQTAPQNFRYNAEIVVGGKSVYTKADLTHNTHTRWRKLFWWGGDAPTVDAQLNSQYLIASRAVPNYDPSVIISAGTLSGMAARTASNALEPMAIGVITGYMPMTGAHEDIGILPAWTTSYVMTMDKRARDTTLIAGDGAGSFPMHYRDQKTGRPVSLTSYPYMTLNGNYGDTWNPSNNKMEAFPGCGGDCSSPYTPDIPHQPSLAYVPYLVTGDYYYLEEMQFWAMFDVFASNPNYRENVKGLVWSEQLRGQAWALRTLAQAAYITPDADVLKADLVGFMNNNLDWYNATYANNPNANKLGVLTNGYSVAYNNGTSTAAWMDDFFTSAIGHAAELGFEKAKTLLAWKAKFPVGRMTAPGVCWIMGAPYGLTIRNNENSPVYNTLLEGYIRDFGTDLMNLPCNSQAMATKLNVRIGDMGGISDGNMGYPSNMQPALAYSADAGIPNAKTAWNLFMSRTVKPDYSQGAQFAIVPR
jgi:hypothetical protein